MAVPGIPLKFCLGRFILLHTNQTLPDQIKHVANNFGPDVTIIIALFLQSVEGMGLKRVHVHKKYLFRLTKPKFFSLHSFQGIQRLYEEGDDGEELDEGVGEEAVEEEEQDEEEEKEKDGEHEGMQTKHRLLPERRSRRLKSEVSCWVDKEIETHYKIIYLLWSPIFDNITNGSLLCSVFNLSHLQTVLFNLSS